MAKPRLIFDMESPVPSKAKRLAGKGFELVNAGLSSVLGLSQSGGQRAINRLGEYQSRNRAHLGAHLIAGNQHTAINRNAKENCPEKQEAKGRKLKRKDPVDVSDIRVWKE
jgi:hypothetical protein